MYGKEYNSFITQDDEAPELIKLNINGTAKRDLLPFLSSSPDYSKIETTEEVRRFKTVEDLRSEIGREVMWRKWEKVIGWTVMGGSFISGVASSINADSPLEMALALGSVVVGLSAGQLITIHAEDGIKKYKSALGVFKTTPFRVVMQEFEQATEAQS